MEVSLDSNLEVSPGADPINCTPECEEKCIENVQSISQEENENKTVLEETIDEGANTDIKNSNMSSTYANNLQDERKDIIPEEIEVEKSLQCKTRSHSCKENGTKSNVSRSRRRKCESESGMSNSTDDEGFEDKVIQLREKDLEKVIGNFVDKLIRESIATAVKSVNVDSVCEEVLMSISRSQSESSDSTGYPETVLQKLHTDSVTEYADLRMVHTFEESKPEEGQSDERVLEHSEPIKQLHVSTETAAMPNYSANIQTGGELDNVVIQNKLAESFEALENADIASDAICLDVEEVSPPRIGATENKNIVLKEKDAQVKHENSAVKEILEDSKFDLDNGSFIGSQSRASVQIIGSMENETFCETGQQKEAESSGNFTDTEKSNTDKNRSHVEVVFPSEEGPTTKDSSTENIANNELAGISKKLVDKQIEMEEESKEMDGYHADCEESASIHSLASESSCENVKEEQSSPPATSEESESKESCEEGSKVPKNFGVEADLMAMSGDDFSQLLTPSQTAVAEPRDLGENLPEQKQTTEEEKKVNWKVGYLHVKLPHKARGKGHLKVWKKRCVAIQPDEFADDPTNPCLVLSVYSGESGVARKHSASFWKSVSCHKAVVFRSSSRTHKYAFTVSDDQGAVVHLSAESEAIAQEWMAAIRAILWPPSPVVQLEKMLNGSQFEVSIIDNDFSYRAGLLGAYGHLTITPRKLILIHPQQGYVVQEWYLNTVDKFQLVSQTRIEDVNKVLAMTTCSDSSTGRGDILIFCKEAVGLLQAVATTIHSILTQHSKEEGGTYQKELEEIGQWLDLPQPQEDYYKVPPKQVKSLLDIPNFIFDKPVSSAVAVTNNPGSSMDTPITSPVEASSETAEDDFLNCSVTSWNPPRKSSDSELSDAYSPPRSPDIKAKREAEHE
ncbi:PH domain-containing protein [Nephila pilipes]|uniref:PH domain-containing protein n=1 Tax=Nephila pilipes TaxID=299642 RepID=A0A8X6PWL2_NEPPI|nr:PH domain-containing protein [Nephila pilipes]